MSKVINCWWPREPKPGNVGDIITPVIISKLSQHKAKWVSLDSNRDMLLSTGSILNKAISEKFTVWGSGAMRLADIEKVSPDANILSVRGPLTQELIYSKFAKTVDVLGDPALLVPLFFSPSVNKKYEYGIIPHYVDYKEVKKKYQKYKHIKVIDVLNADPLKTITEIMECEKTISSSLHGIIFSNAYKIPSCWVKFSDRLKGDGTKFRDYLLYCGEHMKNYEKVEDSFINPDKFDKLRYISLEKSLLHEPTKNLKIFLDWANKS